MTGRTSKTQGILPLCGALIEAQQLLCHPELAEGWPLDGAYCIYKSKMQAFLLHFFLTKSGAKVKVKRLLRRLTAHAHEDANRKAALLLF